jgi:glucose/mannose transport system permease protein
VSLALDTKRTAPRGVKSGSPTRRRLGRVFVYTALVIASAFYLVPLYLVVVTALKDASEIQLATTWSLPSEWNWGSFTTAWQAFAPKLFNSLVLGVTATLGSAILGSLNGYVLSKWSFRGANVVFPLMLFGMFIPYQSILIPLFQFLRDIGLYGSIWGLSLTHIVYGLPITTLIFRNFYAEIPDEMLEAAKIDGAGFFGIYRRILFPLSLSGFVVVIIWQFTQIWNEFLFAVTLTSQATQPITVALAQLAGGEAVRWNLPMAGAILAALPTLLIYIVLGRYFIRGLLAGSVKG